VVAKIREGLAVNKINSVWETMRENIKISAKRSLGYFEFKKHKPQFDEGCSKLLDQRQKAKLQGLQDPGEVNFDNIFFNPLLFASCTNTFSKCCEITTTTGMKRSAQ
jgi:hypothetical protein